MPAVTWDTIGLYRDDKSSYIVLYIYIYIEKGNVNKKINRGRNIEWKIIDYLMSRIFNFPIPFTYSWVLDVSVPQNDKLNRSLDPIRSYVLCCLYIYILFRNVNSSYVNILWFSVIHFKSLLVWLVYRFDLSIAYEKLPID